MCACGRKFPQELVKQILEVNMEEKTIHISPTQCDLVQVLK